MERRLSEFLLEARAREVFAAHERRFVEDKQLGIAAEVQREAHEAHSGHLQINFASREESLPPKRRSRRGTGYRIDVMYIRHWKGCATAV